MAGLTLVPMMVGVGAAVDYSRASDTRAALQSALDAALIAGVKDGSATWTQTASSTFNAVIRAKSGATIGTPSFTQSGTDGYSAAVSATVPVTFLAMVGYSSVNVTASSSAVGGLSGDNSCVLTLDSGASLSDVSLLFGGAPNIALTNCTVRSNTSLSCNGHDSGATASIATGTATSCSNPQSGVRAVPDMYAKVAQNIAPLCGGASMAVTWTAGQPRPPAVKTVSQGTYTEYHVCGDLTVSGSGTLISSSADSLLVIENGSLTLDNSAKISTVRTAIVLTGNNSHSSSINFPNGNGQLATLSLSPPLTGGNPWQGIALYQDPALTLNVDDNWGPGATFSVDGIVYLPNASVTLRGVANSNNYQCTKLVTKKFNTNGSVTLMFAQQKTGCDTIGMKQWADVPVRLTQ